MNFRVRMNSVIRITKHDSKDCNHCIIEISFAGQSVRAVFQGSDEMDPDFFGSLSLWVIKLGSFVSVTILVVKKIVGDLRAKP